MPTLVERLKEVFSSEKSQRDASEAAALESWAIAQRRLSLDANARAAAEVKPEARLVYGMYDEGTGKRFSVASAAELRAEFGSDQKLMQRIDRLAEGKSFVGALNGGDHEHPEAVIKAFRDGEAIPESVNREATERVDFNYDHPNDMDAYRALREAEQEALTQKASSVPLLSTTDANRAAHIEMILEEQGIPTVMRQDASGASTFYVQSEGAFENAQRAIDAEVLDQRTLRWAPDADQKAYLASLAAAGWSEHEQGSFERSVVRATGGELKDEATAPVDFGADHRAWLAETGDELLKVGSQQEMFAIYDRLGKECIPCGSKWEKDGISIYVHPEDKVKAQQALAQQVAKAEVPKVAILSTTDASRTAEVKAALNYGDIGSETRKNDMGIYTTYVAADDLAAAKHWITLGQDQTVRTGAQGEYAVSVYATTDPAKQITTEARLAAAHIESHTRVDANGVALTYVHKDDVADARSALSAANNAAKVMATSGFAVHTAMNQRDSRAAESLLSAAGIESVSRYGADGRLTTYVHTDDRAEATKVAEFATGRKATQTQQADQQASYSAGV